MRAAFFTSLAARVSLAALVFGAAGAVRAVEPTMEFLRALESAHYGEVGIDYIESLKAQNKLPPALKDTYDLQMAIFIKDSVREAYNAPEREQREARYKALVEKFIKEHPQSPDVTRAKALLGDAAYENSMLLLAEAKLNTDKAQAEKQMEEARKGFQDARAGLAATVAGLKDKFEKLQATAADGKTRTKRDEQKLLDAVAEAKVEFFDARLKAAMDDYYVAQTYLDVNSGPRKEALKVAGRSFDGIYQENRGDLTVLGIIGLYAHVWDGKCADEIGDEVKAQDIYDEVRAMEPESPQDAKAKPTGLETLLAQNANFDMLITLRKKGVEAYIEDAGAWLKNWDATGGKGANANPDSPLKQAYRATEGYQAISLQYVKLLLDKAKKTGGSEGAKLAEVANKRLKDMVKVKSDSRLEAMRLLKGLAGGDGGEGGDASKVAEIKDFNEAALSADEAAGRADWEAALKYYERAIELGDSPGKPGKPGEAAKDKEDRKKRLDEMKTGLDKSLLAAAFLRFQKDKLDEAYELASKAAKSPDITSETAPKAAAFCVQILLSQSAAIKDPDKAKEQAAREEILEKMKRVADFTLKKWGDRPEADDVRIALGRSAAMRGQYAEAIKMLEEVNPRSDRLAQARQLAGTLHYHLYVMAKAKPPAERDQALIDSERDLAEKQLLAGLDHLKRKQTSGAQGLSSELIDVQQLLADVKYESGDYKGAVGLLQPIIENYKAHKPEEIGKSVQKTFILAVRSYNAMGDFTGGGAAAEALIDLSDVDSLQVNTISTNFVGLLDKEYKLAEAQLTDARTDGDPGKIETAEQKVFALKSNLAKLVDKLAAKQNHTLADRIYLGMIAAKVGAPGIAEQLYKVALDQAENEKKAGADEKSPALKAIPSIRAQLVGLLQQKGEFDRGITEIDKLIADQPRALEPKVVKARLMQAWAEKDPGRLQAAAVEWARLCNLLRPQPGKKPLTEYYEANYFTANCLWMEYEATKNVAKAVDAGKRLHTMFLTSPSLSGPDMVAKYNQLIAKINRVVGDTPVKSAANPPN